MMISTLQFQVPPVAVAQLLEAAKEHLLARQPAVVEKLCQQVLFFQPGCPEALLLVGLAASQGRDHEKAITWVRQAVAAAPRVPMYHNNLSVVYSEAGRYEEAIDSARRVVALQPGLADGHHNLARALSEKGEFVEAISSARQALALRRESAESHLILSNSLAGLGDRRAALECLREALRLQPNSVEAYNNMASLLYEGGAPEEAVSWLEKALALAPEYLKAHQNMARLQLLLGHLERGFAEFEYREDRAYQAGLPEWDGSDLEGRTLLLLVEQGFGDTIHFVRYLERLTTRVVLLCQSELVNLLRANFPNVEILPAQGDSNRSGVVDVWSPLLSLPFRFRTTLESIPNRVPYLRAEPAKVSDWQLRLGARGQFTVGLAWAGSKRHVADAKRSFELARLEPVLAVPGITFHSLQKGEAATQAAGTAVIDHEGELTDFAETAALLEQFDLVIAADTAVAHLAGAMGKQVWMLVPFAPDWRWMRDRSDTPWYPTMRLFRQTEEGNWDGVVRRVAVALAHLAGGA